METKDTQENRGKWGIEHLLHQIDWDPGIHLGDGKTAKTLICSLKQVMRRYASKITKDPQETPGFSRKYRSKDQP